MNMYLLQDSHGDSKISATLAGIIVGSCIGGIAVFAVLLEVVSRLRRSCYTSSLAI